jgi:hypothetical protein
MTRATLSNSSNAVNNVHADEQSTSPVRAAPSPKSCHTVMVSASVALTTGDHSDGRHLRHLVCYIREPTCQPCRETACRAGACMSTGVCRLVSTFLQLRMSFTYVRETETETGHSSRAATVHTLPPSL